MEKVKFEELDINLIKEEEKERENSRNSRSNSIKSMDQSAYEKDLKNNSQKRVRDHSINSTTSPKIFSTSFPSSAINKIAQAMKRRETTSFSNKATIYFGPDKSHENFTLQNEHFGDNRISTTKYNIFTWFPKSLLMQFKRIANIYFLLISILTILPLSPKSPYSQIMTFVIVLFFSMVKEGIEDYKRYKMDNEVNNKFTNYFDYLNELNANEGIFIKKLWYELRVGDLVRINKDEALPADVLILHSSFKSGLAFVDTKDLDGETNLKEKMVHSDFNKLNQKNLFTMEGSIQLDQPNEYMDSWEGNVFVSNYLNSIQNNDEENIEENKFISNVNIKQLLLKGSILRNTEYIIGLVVYCGHNTKIMKNAKKPPIKMSNVMKIMNKLLLSVFLFQILICTVFSVMNFVFRYKNNKYIEIYIGINQEITISSLVQKFFTFLVAYSHLIPISLYVAMEIVKLLQSWFVFYDDFMFDYKSNKPSEAKTSELIEQLGQVEIIFSDKTGTLTQNSMLFKKCFVGDKIYGHIWEDEIVEESSEEDSKSDINSSISNSHSGDKNNLENLNNLNNLNFNVNGDPTPFKILNNGSKCSYWELNYKNTHVNNFISEDKKNLMEFFLVCSVCHSGNVDKDLEGNLKYSSSSPDEIALIQGASNMGFTFTNRTSDTIEVQNGYTNSLEVWEVLVELPFDSYRKRMSLLVKNKNDLSNTVYILTKGADNIMMPRLKMENKKKAAAIGKSQKF
jgi:phospholipid-translocating P-type ATPase (flippase)